VIRRGTPVRQWLLLGALLVAAMVVIGGITRLTGSGLSITEWNVLMGAFPPLSDQAWDLLFAKYRATPQYQLVNAHFTLAEFKAIFWWEYLHRLLGRALGVVFLVPFIWFVVRGNIRRPEVPRFLAIFALGALQGALGWFMVASGLVDVPRVSHVRLAAHLVTALTSYGLIVWTILDLSPAKPGDGVEGPGTLPVSLQRAVALVMGLLVVQIVYGAFVAGLKAGFLFNTWPLMGSGLIPPGMGTLSPVLADPVQNPVTIQFLHRTIGVGLLAGAAWLAWAARSAPAPVARASAWFGAMVLGQFLLGVAAILWLPAHPVLLGATHQAGALVVLTGALVLAHRMGRTLSGPRPAIA